MKQIYHFSEIDTSRVFLRESQDAVSAEVVLNTSVSEKFQKTQEEVDTETRLNQAEKAALQAMPEFGENLIDDIEGKSRVKKLEKRTRSKVFDVLEKAGDRNSAWGKKYKDTVKAIKKEKVDTSLTLENVERVENTFGSLKSQFETMVNHAMQAKDSTEEYRRKWFRSRWWTLGLPVGYQGDPESLGSEQSRFKDRLDVVHEIFSEIGNKIEARKLDAQSFVDRTAAMLEAGFNTLTPTQKTDFLDQVQIDISISNHSFGGAFAFAKTKIERHHRLEAYKKLGWDTSYFNQEIATYEKDQEKLRENTKDYRDTINGISPNFEKIREYMKDSEANTDAPDLSSLLSELDTYITSHGSVGREDLFSDFPQAENLDNYAKFLIYSEFLGEAKNKVTTKNMPKGLKKKYLAYLNYLDEEERPDNFDSYSSLFQTQHGEVKILFDESKSLISTLEGFTSFNTVSPFITSSHYTDIDNRISEISKKKAAYEAISSQLETVEKDELEKYFEELIDFSKRLSDLKKKWRKEEMDYTSYLAAHNTWENRRSQLETAVTNANKPKDVNAANQILVQHDANEPKAPLLTLVSSEFSDISLKLKQTSSEIDSVSFSGRTTNWKVRVKEALQRSSQEEKNKMYREKLARYQEQSFSILLKMPRGRKFEIDFERYTHGRDFACDDVLTRHATPQQNLRVLEKTGDAVICRQEGTDVLYVIQKSTDGRINVLIFDDPGEYTAGAEIKPNFKFSDHPDVVREPMSIKFT